MIRILRSLAFGLSLIVLAGAVWVPSVERAGAVLLHLAALYFVYQSAANAGFVPPFRFLFA